MNRFIFDLQRFDEFTNYTPVTLVGGSSGDDAIYNYGTNVTIDTFEGNDTVENYVSTVSIDGGADADYLLNWDWSNENVTVLGGNGNDTIRNVGSYSNLEGGNGDDSISNWNDFVTINSGAGKDTIENSNYYDTGDNVSINGGDNDDDILNWGNSVTVDGGAGNDIIKNYQYNGGAQNVTITGGKGNDSIHNAGENVLFKYAAGDGNDTIRGFNATSTLTISGATFSTEKSGSDILVTVGDGKITLEGATSLDNINIVSDINIVSNSNSNTLVTGSAGVDSINNSGSNVTINTDGGNDTIYSSGDVLSINGGADNNFVHLYADAYNATVLTGSGKDTVETAAKTASIVTSFGKDFVYLYANAEQHTINTGDGDDSVDSGGKIVSIVTGSGNDSIHLYGNAENHTIDTGDGNDTVESAGKVVSIVTGGDNDYIYLYNNAEDHTINSGTGSDTVYTGGQRVSINTGADNDYIHIYTNATKNTVNSGAGDDTIRSYNENGVLYLYEIGSGNDSILGFTDKDTLQIGDGKDVYSKKIVDNDIIITVGQNKITLSGAESLSSPNIHGVIDGGALKVTISANNTMVSGTKYNDSISVTGSNVTVNAAGGKDIIENSGGNAVINGGANNDSLSNTSANNVTLNGGSGSDTLRNSNYNNVSMNGNGGSDKIYNSANYVTMNGGDGNDSIVVENSYAYITTINGGAGADKITAYGGVIDGGSGNDQISLGAYLDSGVDYGATIKGKSGDDTIYGTSAGNIVYEFNKGDGNDQIYNYKTGDTIAIGGNEVYTKTTNGSNVVIKLNSGGSMTLNNASSQKLNISGGIESLPGGKNIKNTASNTVIGGTNAADTISNSYGNNVEINAGAGNDTIYNNGGKDITLAGGDGDDTINDAYADNIYIDGGNGADSIYGNNNYATIKGGAGKDTILGNHYKSNIAGDGDNDLISLTTYWYNTIDGGEGSDSIYAGGGQHSVNGGAGADLISLSGGELTVQGGTGDDTIYGASTESHFYQYTKGDGKDTIYGFNSSDSITISGGSASTTNSGQNVIVQVDGSNVMTLINANGKTINIYSDTPDTSIETTQQEVIKRFMYSLNANKNDSGKAALDKAVNYASNGYFANLSTIINQMVVDCKNLGSAEFLEKCGINLTNKDTGAITGSDAGGSKVKTAENVVPESGNLNTNFYSTSFTTANGLTFRLSKTNLSNDELYIWQALKTWWADEGQNLIKESYDYSFLDSDAPVKEITVVFEEDYKGGYLAYTDWPKYINGRYTRTLGINKVYFYDFASTDVNGKSPNGQGYLDRTVAHELTHAIMMSKITNFGDLPQFITEGTAELVHGIDDYRGNVIDYLSKNYQPLQESLSLMPGTGESHSYAGGFMLLRYLAKQSAEHYSSGGSGSKSAINAAFNAKNVTVKNNVLTVSKNYIGNELDLADYSSKVKKVNAKSFSKGLMISGNKNANSIAAGTGNDTIFANVGKDTLVGGKGNDILYGEAGNDLIKGEAGNDSINGGTGNDTLTGGDGSDIFIFGKESGKDTITDYTVGKDKIKIIDGGITGASISGSDLILEADRSGLITIKKGKDKKITVIDGTGATITKKYSDAEKILTVTNKTKSPVTIDSSIQGVDASDRTTAVKITGNKLDNIINGGSNNDILYGGKGNDSLAGNAGNDKLYGGAGSDTLWGGKGNDSLWGDAGADTFIYAQGDGKDIIFGFEDNDTLTLDSLDFTPSYKDKVVTLKFDSGSITLKNFTATTFHINDDTYQISNSKFVKK